MAWYINKIPRILHVYYGGPNLSYLRYLTLYTFSKLNPNWKIKFYYPKKYYIKTSSENFPKYCNDSTGKNYKEEISKLPNTEVIEIDFDVIDIGNRPEAWRADILKLKTLGTEGGFYADMDIIFFKSLDEADFNTLENFPLDTIISYTSKRHHYSIGFMGANKNNSFFNYLYERVIKNVNLSGGDYQQFGSIFWKEQFNNPKHIEIKFPNLNIYNIDMYLTYPLTSSQVDQILSGNVALEDERTIALHWFGGHPNSVHWENLLTEDNIENYNTTLTNVIKGALK